MEMGKENGKQQEAMYIGDGGRRGLMWHGQHHVNQLIPRLAPLLALHYTRKG